MTLQQQKLQEKRTSPWKEKVKDRFQISKIYLEDIYFTVGKTYHDVSAE